MMICATCGNDYKKPLKISIENDTFYFDCFECAISKLAPICQNCGCRIIGHGVESDNFSYCCSHCLREAEASANAKTP